MRKNQDIKYSIDLIKIDEKSLTIIGWANSKDPTDKVFIDVTDTDGNMIKYRKKRTERRDVSMARYGDIVGELYGFTLSFPYSSKKNYYFKLFNRNTIIQIKITKGYILAENLWKRIASTLWRKPLRDLSHTKPISYSHWYKRAKPSKETLAKQESFVFPADAPKFSIVIPLYKTPENYLQSLMKSISQQTYKKFEVCFADGSPDDDKLEKFVKKYANEDTRFKYHFIGKNKGISGNTNEALKMSTGDFIVLCDHDDLLTSNALYEFAQAIVNNPDCDTIYSDEDKINSDGTKLFEPHFKPDYNIDLLTSTNYICHLFAARKSLIDQFGTFNAEFDGSQDYDFIFRMTEHSRNVIHVAKILYHWRTHQNSTSTNPESKLYAFDAGARAILAHYKRVWPNISIDKVEYGISLGIYHTCFTMTKQPLISIIIPNMDHIEDLDKAIRSVLSKSTWRNLEIIIVENNSQDPETFTYYKKIEAEFSQIHVIYYKDSFNYSKINNFGVLHAHGDYLLFMNNDVELINHDSISEMMGYAQRNDVGIVGCLLLYEDNTIQHAGVVIGICGIANHIFRGCSSKNDTYFNRAMTAQDYSAVTAAVMLVRRDTFEAAAGFDEHYAIAFNDIDFCLKVRSLDKLVVYTPYASFYHHESKSRGTEDTFEKQVRFVSEIKRFLTEWRDFIVAGDPYYNTNLSVHSTDCAYRNLPIEKIGDTFYSSKYMDCIISQSPEEFVRTNQNC